MYLCKSQMWLFTLNYFYLLNLEWEREGISLIFLLKYAYMFWQFDILFVIDLNLAVG